jgi:hypothetical protein
VRALFAVPLLLALAPSFGCFADPACQDHCDGDTIVRCYWECQTRRTDILPRDCERIETRTDCDDGDTCVYGLASNSPEGSSGTPTCVEAPVTPCDLEDGLYCVGPNHAVNCRETTEGGVEQSYDDALCSDQPGTECHTLSQGITCVASPKVSCDPDEEPVCQSDASTLVRCDGRDGNFARYEITCTAGCEPGAAACNSPT